MTRHRLLLRGACVAAAIAFIPLGRVATADRPGSGRFELVEATIDSIHAAYDNHLITPERLVRMYHARIAAYDGKSTAAHLNSYIYLNPGAIEEAAHQTGDVMASDEGLEHGRGHHRGPLTGIPIILKDNVDTADMPTTAGSVAFAGSFPRTDAFVARKLRD